MLKSNLKMRYKNKRRSTKNRSIKSNNNWIKKDSRLNNN